MAKMRVIAALAGLCILLSGCAVQGGSGLDAAGFDLETRGLSDLVSLLEEHFDAEKPDAYRLVSFRGTIDAEVQLTDFILELEAYDAARSPLGITRFERTDGVLRYTPPAENADRSHEAAYDANTDLTYIDAQLRRLPIRRQMEQLGCGAAYIFCNGVKPVTAGEPVIDGRDGGELPVLTREEYQYGRGGSGDGNPALQISLKMEAGYSFTYLCQPADELALPAGGDPGDREQCMVTGDGLLRFSGDYGETWMTCDMTPQQVEEALAVYPNGRLPAGQFYVSAEAPYTVAFLYGDNPRLCITRDGGTTWQSDVLATGLDNLGYSGRAVHFFDGMNGYAAVGTEWTMSRGVFKEWYITFDGGATWEEQPDLPGAESDMLSGLTFCDLEHGVVSVHGVDGVPEVYGTDDGGRTWTLLDLGEGISGYVLNLQHLDGHYQFEMESTLRDHRAVYQGTAVTGEWQMISE